MHSLSPLRRGTARVARSAPLSRRTAAHAPPNAPGASSRPARGGCSVTRRAAVRWASACLLCPAASPHAARASKLFWRALFWAGSDAAPGGRADRARRALAAHHSSRVQPGAKPRGSSVAPLRAVARPPVAGRTRCFGRPSRGAPSLAAQSWGASSPTFLSEHPGVRAGSSCAARRRLSRFPPDGGA